MHSLDSREETNPGKEREERIHEDDTFMHHQRGSITSTYTTDWFLREVEYRRKRGDWLKGTSVKSQDQRRILQEITHNLPSNVWIHKITKGKESNKCDLYKALRIKETASRRRQTSRNRTWAIPAHMQSSDRLPHNSPP